MSTSYTDALQRYLQYFETMTPDTVGEIRALAAPDLHFRDPFNDVRDVEKVVTIMQDMFRDTENPKFVILKYQLTDAWALLKWEMTFTPKKVRCDAPWRIVGLSEVTFSSEGKVIEHIDYWDAAENFYERLPLIGTLLRMVKRRLQV